MTRPGDRSLRIAEEVRSFARQGRRIGLLQTSRPKADDRISPEVQTCIRRGLAAVVDLASKVSAGRMLIHDPSEVDWQERSLSAVVAEEATLICYRAGDFATPRIRARLKGSRTVRWAPTNHWLRQSAPARCRLTPQDWRPPAASSGSVKAKTNAAPTAIGWLTTTAPPAAPARNVNVVAIDLAAPIDFSLDRIRALDGLAYFPKRGETDLPDALITAALAVGLPVALAKWLQPHYGDMAHYCDQRQAISWIASQLPSAAPERRSRPVTTSGKAGSSTRPALFLAANGTGIGHLSRLAAIARRMDPKTPILFASQAQAVSAIERLGFRTEFMPSATYVGGNFEAWDDWFRFELEQLVDSFDPAIVVYDGNNPSPGLLKATMSRRDCRLAWVRRGLWGKLNSPFIDHSRWFDLVIEPGEIEGQPDEGVTARRRAEAVLVPPVRLLDAAELLPRREAAAALGLDPAQPAVLIQLGAGYNRDVVSLLDHLVTVLSRVPRLQVCIAEWVNGSQALTYWPKVTYLRGYPLSQYFKAFDFSIAAAGYNTFHEVVHFGLPTIFIPNRHPTMDDQAGRAVHAQARQAAFELDETELDDLPDLIAIMMDTKARDFLREAGKQLYQPNGAAEAANALQSLIWGQDE